MTINKVKIPISISLPLDVVLTLDKCSENFESRSSFILAAITEKIANDKKSSKKKK